MLHYPMQHITLVTAKDVVTSWVIFLLHVTADVLVCNQALTTYIRHTQVEVIEVLLGARTRAFICTLPLLIKSAGLDEGKRQGVHKITPYAAGGLDQLPVLSALLVDCIRSPFRVLGYPYPVTSVEYLLALSTTKDILALGSKIKGVFEEVQVVPIVTAFALYKEESLVCLLEKCVNSKVWDCRC